MITKEHYGLSTYEMIRMKLDAERYRYEDEQVALKYQSRHALKNSIYEGRNKDKEQRLRGMIMAAKAEEIENTTKSTIDWILENYHGDTEEFKEKLKWLQTQTLIINLRTLVGKLRHVKQ
ncbi:hypothetical protein SUGI_0707390 [Cryptomeria japonica]|nr:hypothetical protein SUGI_0707390 [Cryptomeria japonica]